MLGEPSRRASLPPGESGNMAESKVAELEKKLGIFDVARFTPAASGPAPT
jgi:hypothetical protein